MILVEIIHVLALSSNPFQSHSSLSNLSFPMISKDFVLMMIILSIKSLRTNSIPQWLFYYSTFKLRRIDERNLKSRCHQLDGIRSEWRGEVRAFPQTCLSIQAKSLIYLFGLNQLMRMRGSRICSRFPDQFMLSYRVWYLPTFHAC